MKVILTDNVKNVGRKGDIANVSDGYANNFLFKNKLAVPASAGNLNINAQEKAAEAKRIKEETEAAQNLANKLKDVVVTLGVKVGDNGKTFGSVSGKEISDELAKMGYEIDKKKIELETPIKTVGTYTITLRLYKGVVGKVKVQVEGV
ncbi:MAG: 50S ribosomal protein L9 [Clostridia bacterium]|nr:50S ribosomal protein L9 [Clostridia bacterium]